jgi:cytochrome c oxidase cbb3-type subunit 3
MTFALPRVGTLVTLGLTLAALALAACEREARRFGDTSPAPARGERVVMSEIQPGPAAPRPATKSPYDRNAYAVSEGKTLYDAMNCSGCHAQGGGNIGPPLLDDEWIYGSEPENVFATIAEGRPNGMPAYGGKLPPEQIWRLVAYVRSMSAVGVPQDVRSGRSDHMAARPPEQMEEPRRPRGSGVPPASQGTR